MALANYELDLMTHVASGIGSLTLGTNAFAGPLRSAADGAPHLCVGCVLTGGPVPTELMDGGSSHLHEPSLAITVRSAPDTYQTARDLAESIWEAVHNGAVTGYQWVRCQQSTPLYAGVDNNRSHYFTINVTMAKVE